MSNGNDDQNVPPPPNDPPGHKDPGSSKGTDPVNAEPGSRDPQGSDSTPGRENPIPSPDRSVGDETVSMPAPFPKDERGKFDDSAPPTQRTDSGPGAGPQNAGSQHADRNGPQNPGPQYDGPQHPGQNGPQGQGGPGPQHGYGAPQNQGGPGPRYGEPQQAAGPYPGGQYPGGQNSGPGGSQHPNGPGQHGPGQDAPHQNGPYQGGAPYQSGPQQTGSGPRTGSGPGSSQAIPQPAPAPGYAGSTATATRAQSRPAKKKGRLPLFIALGSVVLVLVLVLVGVLVVNSVNKNNYGPDKVAEDYVTALNDGDFAGAEKIAPSPRPEGTNLDLLSKNFTDASAAKIENAKVETSQVDGDNGTVVVTYELDGSTYNVDLTAKKDGKQNLFFDKWTLAGPALHVISLDVPGADGLTINGNDYQAQAGTTAFAVYPGNYEFAIPASKWVSEASDTAAANFPQAYAPGDQPNSDQVSPLTLNLDLAPTGEFEKEVQKQVEAELNKCFDNKDIQPKCKFIKFDPTEIPIGGTDQKLDELAKKDTAKWDIKDMPQVKADFGVGDTNTGSFFTEKNGKFDFSVEAKQSGSSYFSNGNPLSVSGNVKIDGDKLSVEFFDF